MADDDMIQLKKDKLGCHLPFILQMLEKTRGTELDVKWQTMHKCIISNKKV